MTDRTDPTAFIHDLCDRLADLAENRPFRFRDTTRLEARLHLSRRVLFDGCADAEIADAERALGLRLPAMLAAFHRVMGRARGELFRGSDVACIDEIAGMTAHLRGMARAAGGRLPDAEVAILLHQGYSGLYTLGTPPELPRVADAPVFAITEGDAEPRRAAPSFAACLEQELALMQEVNAMQIAQGGHYLTVRGRSVTESHPALASGDRPLDTEDRFLD